jgi:DNA-binding MarR family transcriptional regulator
MSFDPVSVRAHREQMLLRLLFRATHAMNAEMTRRVRARGWTTFQPTFTTLLSHLDTEGTTISTLATRIGISRQAVSQLARTIEHAGLIERVPHPTDRRSVIVRHTADGRRILLDALEVMAAIESEYAERAGETEVAGLKHLLAHLLGEIDAVGALLPDERASDAAPVLNRSSATE